MTWPPPPLETVFHKPLTEKDCFLYTISGNRTWEMSVVGRELDLTRRWFKSIHLQTHNQIPLNRVYRQWYLIGSCLAG